MNRRLSENLPYGIRFAERVISSKPVDFTGLYYDESLDCTLVNKNNLTTPFVEDVVSCLATQTITEQQEEPEDNEDENFANLPAILMTQTTTKETQEDPDRQEDEISFW